MTLKLYGKPISPCTLRVVVVLKEKSIPYEFIDVAFDEIGTPEYLSKNPFGKFPYMVFFFSDLGHVFIRLTPGNDVCS